MFSYSQIVDRAVARSMRADRLEDIKDFVNQTLEECYENESNEILDFQRDLTEDELVADAEPYIWAYTERGALKAVKYPHIVTSDQPHGVHPKMLQPGPQLSAARWAVYRTVAGYIFKGIGKDGIVQVAYYKQAPTFYYYKEGERPAYWDSTIPGWKYHPNWDINEETRQEARELVSHWIITDYYNLVMEGTMAKVLKLVNASDAAATHYSAFQRGRKRLLSAEVWTARML